jgi:hypothetical protein
MKLSEKGVEKKGRLTVFRKIKVLEVERLSPTAKKLFALCPKPAIQNPVR